MVFQPSKMYIVDVGIVRRLIAAAKTILPGRDEECHSGMAFLEDRIADVERAIGDRVD